MGRNEETDRALAADPQFRPVGCVEGNRIVWKDGSPSTPVDPRYSLDGRYRWWWEDDWGGGPCVCWVGLNPGTGDTDGKPRPTLGRMRTWTERLGYQRLVIVNLFAYRTTQPSVLRAAAKDGIDVVGAGNDDVIRRWSSAAAVTVGAWGGGGRLLGRGAKVAEMIPDLLCLGVTKRGEPRHPLYVSGAVQLTRLAP